MAAGDTIEIDLQVDTEPREVTVPADFAAALDREPEARNNFDRLSYSNRRAHVFSIERAKTDATRQRPIDKSVSTVAAGNIR